MGRAESLEGKMSAQDPSDLWSTPDGEAELLQDLGWYHGNLTRHAAEALLLSNGCDGSYLLRDSNERTGLYSLSVRAKDSVKHFHVEYTGFSFKFGFNEFSSLKDFVKHFANQPLIGSETGTLIVLKHPYPRKVEEPAIYESVRVHTAMQTGRTEDDLVPTAPSTWKTRWFTLHRNELKYFKDQMSPEPIRILDLTECSAVQFDYSQERVNCFCLVFPFRTFYLCAKTGVEADEWIKILRWKLACGIVCSLFWDMEGLQKGIKRERMDLHWRLSPRAFTLRLSVYWSSFKCAVLANFAWRRTSGTRNSHRGKLTYFYSRKSF
ncbi:dual adapter for phosphotyrosine and 3-phosphotyrosine and 3-phosphoinositide isoform X2 [Eptesicus fuscus]|uniref:dual adapter for phosphotyrosine and 3-phosphotyrosine and 3-phosphoinositide isoform X2 n=1 Tax=Eptesicus fuscus TaxID=29078 RepID=UPI002403A89C|nr:dual adapter for phosphotyrosine and 3-phosphotyrosine and 3-phosphoinositide isoform X2 [Eptesicus fuscus]